LGVLRRIVTASSNAGDLVLDFLPQRDHRRGLPRAGRRFILVDDNPEAIEVDAPPLRRRGGHRLHDDHRSALIAVSARRVGVTATDRVSPLRRPLFRLTLGNQQRQGARTGDRVVHGGR
jgi:hypothetical protein